MNDSISMATNDKHATTVGGDSPALVDKPSMAYRRIARCFGLMSPSKVPIPILFSTFVLHHFLIYPLLAHCDGVALHPESG